MPQAHIKKYLSRYAEPEHTFVKKLSEWTWERCIVIPCYNESFEFIARLLKLSNCQRYRIIVIIVLNQPDTEDINDCNQKLHHAIESQFTRVFTEENTALYTCQTLDILLVDRYSKKTIVSKQGVGLARKIGCDVAVQLYDQASLTHQHIYTSDADAWLPNNYFSAELDDKASANLFAFKHQAGASIIAKATLLYEWTLNYYVRGLQWAGSPYAFHTIGSCQSVNILYYCQARGYPKKNAGEDFYLLNKLAKLSPVRLCNGVELEIEARLSDRTPFGTGPAVAKLLEVDADETRAVTYAPDCFLALKACLAAFDSLVCASQIPVDSEAFCQQYKLDNKLVAVLDTLKIQPMFVQLKEHGTTPTRARKIVHDWFDAFRTLKFIHTVQAQMHPAVSVSDAKKARFLST